jgi:hypothetical protein
MVCELDTRKEKFSIIKSSPRILDAFKRSFTKFWFVPGLTFLIYCIFLSANREPSGSPKFVLLDDAMISMTYARTFVSSGEFVWYPGASKIQGFTNPLWTLYMAFIHSLGLESSTNSLLLMITGVIVIMAASILVKLILKVTLKSPSLSLFPSAVASLIPFTFPMTYWTIGGMEVGVLALVLLAILYLLAYDLFHVVTSQRHLWLIGGLLSVGIATRFDFLLISFAVIVFHFCVYRKHDLNRFLVSFLITTGTAISVLLIQRLYYENWVPNTFNLKVQGFDYVDRLLRGSSVSFKFLFLCGIIYYLYKLSATRLNSQFELPMKQFIGLLLGIVVLVLVYNVYVAGDAWEWYLFANRYVSVVLPVFLLLGALISSLFAAESPKSSTPSRGFLVLSLCGIFAALAIGASWPTLFPNPKAILYLLLVHNIVVFSIYYTIKNNHHRIFPFIVVLSIFIATSSLPFMQMLRGVSYFSPNSSLIQQSVDLARISKPNAKVAVVWAGIPGYYGERRMIDMLGKSDEVIANQSPRSNIIIPGHNKWDYGWSIAQLRPDIVLQFWEQRPSNEQMERWGYMQFCWAAKYVNYFKLSSTRINWKALTRCI